jgi:hypothetical protein
MRTVSYNSVLRGAAGRASLELDAISREDEALFRDFISDRLRTAWEYDFWTDLTRVERRFFADVYDAAATYPAGAWVYHPADRSYYQALRETAGNAPSLAGVENSAFWAALKKSYSGSDWVAGTTYAVGQIVRYPVDGLFYQCHTAHTSSHMLKAPGLWLENLDTGLYHRVLASGDPAQLLVSDAGVPDPDVPADGHPKLSGLWIENLDTGLYHKVALLDPGQVLPSDDGFALAALPADGLPRYDGLWLRGTAPGTHYEVRVAGEDFPQIVLSGPATATDLNPAETGGVNRWGLLAEFVRVVPFEQTGRTEMGTVFEVWNLNPRLRKDAKRLRFELGSTGAVVLETVSEVHPEFRLPAPALSGEVWDDTASYSAGDQAQFEGDFYECSAAADAGESPATQPAKWRKVEIPREFERYLKVGAYSDWLLNQKQNEKAAVEDLRAQAHLMNLALLMRGQSRQHTRPVVQVCW